MALRFLACVLLVSACDCGEEPPEADASVDFDAEGFDVGPFDAGRPCVDALPVDMLWVIDNSNSMAQEQENLAVNFPVVIETLTNPPDADGDGTPDFPPITDLRVAVVTTDLGVGSNTGVIGCPSATGDDAVFVSEARGAGECAGVNTGPMPWLQFDGTNADEFNESFACLARLGTEGCGLEQQLEASIRSFGDQAEPGMPNEGFFRSDSLIAVVYVTDEDDCSASSDALFSASPEARTEFGPYPRRCADNPDELHPISRYVSALRALSLDRRGDVVVAAITGVPRDLTADPTNVDFTALLADPRMQFQDDPEDPDKLAPACEFSGVGTAIPARRIVELVGGFSRGNDALLASICEPDLTPTLSALANLVAGRICDAPL